MVDVRNHHHSNNSRTNTPITNDTSIVRLVGASGEPNSLQDTDDADPDIIPNQYGKYKHIELKFITFFFCSFRGNCS